MKTKFNKSLLYACRGIVAAIKEERNVKIHLGMTLLVILMGVTCNISLIEWGVIFLCVSFVVSLEMINTAIEEVVNFISPEHNVKAGKIKDLSAGAILIAALFSAVIGCVIFIPKLFALLDSLRR